MKIIRTTAKAAAYQATVVYRRF